MAVGHAWGDWGRGKGGVRKKEPRKEGPQRLAEAHGLLGAKGEGNLGRGTSVLKSKEVGSVREPLDLQE